MKITRRTGLLLIACIMFAGLAVADATGAGWTWLWPAGWASVVGAFI